jgi:hypothetical protein
MYLTSDLLKLLTSLCLSVLIVCLQFNLKGCHGRDLMVVGLTTTCAICAYHL